jgi:hypothetical protein
VECGQCYQFINQDPKYLVGESVLTYFQSQHEKKFNFTTFGEIRISIFCLWMTSHRIRCLNRKRFYLTFRRTRVRVLDRTSVIPTLVTVLLNISMQVLREYHQIWHDSFLSPFFWFVIYQYTVDTRVTTGLTYEQLGLRPKSFSFDLRPKSWVTTRMPIKATWVTTRMAFRKLQSEPRYTCLWT